MCLGRNRVNRSLSRCCKTLVHAWILHAFCLLDNHYHLCLETPDANLSIGMQWLQSTFANRFNRSIRERGHVFQGRFKCLVVEQDEYLGPLLNYIYLNPLRAGLEPDGSLGTWRWSSLWYLLHKRQRWACMELSRCLYYAGHLADTSAGRKKYLQYLAWLSTSDQAQKEQRFSSICRGWALASREFKKTLMAEDTTSGQERPGCETQEAREVYWEGLLDQMLSFHGKSKREIDADGKSADWKVMIAHYLKRHMAVTNGWLSQHLNMGVLHGVSRYVALFEQANGHKKRPYKQMIARIQP